MPPLSYARHQFPTAIIQHAIWLYLRFTLSYRDVEELLAERGVDVSYESVRRWVLKFGPAIAGNLRRLRPKPSPRWHLDEMVIRVSGKLMHLWRAVDDEGEVLEMLVQRRRDKAAALKLMRKLLKKHGFAATEVTTDDLRPKFPPVMGRVSVMRPVRGWEMAAENPGFERQRPDPSAAVGAEDSAKRAADTLLPLSCRNGLQDGRRPAQVAGDGRKPDLEAEAGQAAVASPPCTAARI